MPQGLTWIEEDTLAPLSPAGGIHVLSSESSLDPTIKDCLRHFKPMGPAGVRRLKQTPASETNYPPKGWMPALASRPQKDPMMHPATITAAPGQFQRPSHR
jgi:hypothetical protein